MKIGKGFINHEDWKKIHQPRRLETKVFNPKGRKKDPTTTKVGNKDCKSYRLEKGYQS